MGNKYSIGTPACSVFSRGVEQGGDGLAVYSVRARLACIGLGVSGVCVPLGTSTSAISIFISYSKTAKSENPKLTRWRLVESYGEISAARLQAVSGACRCR